MAKISNTVPIGRNIELNVSLVTSFSYTITYTFSDTPNDQVGLKFPVNTTPIIPRLNEEVNYDGKIYKVDEVIHSVDDADHIAVPVIGIGCTFLRIDALTRGASV